VSVAIIHSPNTPSWRGAQLKHRGKFIFLNGYFLCFLIKVAQHTTSCSAHISGCICENFTSSFIKSELLYYFISWLKM
jgi:hypothetical protein